MDTKSEGKNFCTTILYEKKTRNLRAKIYALKNGVQITKNVVINSRRACSENMRQEPGDRRQKSEDNSQKSADRRQKSGDRSIVFFDDTIRSSSIEWKRGRFVVPPSGGAAVSGMVLF